MCVIVITGEEPSEDQQEQVEPEEEEEEVIRTAPSSKVFKEGFLEKKGHSSAFFMWPK